MTAKVNNNNRREIAFSPSQRIHCKVTVYKTQWPVNSSSTQAPIKYQCQTSTQHRSICKSAIFLVLNTVLINVYLQIKSLSAKNLQSINLTLIQQDKLQNHDGLAKRPQQQQHQQLSQTLINTNFYKTLPTTNMLSQSMTLSNYMTSTATNLNKQQQSTSNTAISDQKFTKNPNNEVFLNSGE